jgi:hypothetical protein
MNDGCISQLCHAATPGVIKVCRLQSYRHPNNTFCLAGMFQVFGYLFIFNQDFYYPNQTKAFKKNHVSVNETFGRIVCVGVT